MMKFALASVILGVCFRIALSSPIPSYESKNALCQALTKSDVQTIPGWQKLQDRVTADLGQWDNFYVNWEKKPGYPAYVCSNTLPTDYGSLSGGGCTKSTIILTGKLNTEGVVSVSLISGDQVTSTVSVSQEIEYAHAVTIGFEKTYTIIPLLVDLKYNSDITVSGKTTNSKASSFETTSTGLVRSTLTIMPRANETCAIHLSQNTCSLHATAHSPITASGWVWFVYPKKVKGYYEWGYLLESVLSPDERSVNAALAVKMDITSYGNYSTVCECKGYCEPLVDRDLFPIDGELEWSDQTLGSV